MAGKTDAPKTTHEYELFCTDRDFEAVVTGTVHDALDIADTHREEYEDPIEDHFVTFKRGNDDA